MKRVLIAGCGFVGNAAAQLFHRAGWDVAGVTRSVTSVKQLAGEPWRVVACDVTDRTEVAAKLADFAGVDALIDCVSASGGGADEYRKTYLDGAANLLEILRPKTFVFTSSTSVYAQTDGSWVTEESPADPRRETGKILRETEDFVLARGGIVARLAGIYGPGRAALLRKFLDGSAVIEGDGGRWLNYIHRDDAAGALFFLADRAATSGIYNVADDHPVTQLEYFRWLAEHFARPFPSRGPIDTDRKRGWTSKRASNAKLRALGWRCAWPSFKDALAEIKART
jgi:nucleoside-diphosphate-sugar epimerase